ncbi:hypothetical protein FNV43_RR20193 [Rhamnella rubrinervis]|uniref:Uncharacterized protein n=1 Tax=Rhamnella rubrinervis TaxID=2594499 RepID=A0A8K0GWU8_9ROSA|nr:hypothetical protein FNV43_RR20193 [Rhamnella rubrinervis]
MEYHGLSFDGVGMGQCVSYGTPDSQPESGVICILKHRKPADGMLMGNTSPSSVGDGPASLKYSDRPSPLINTYLSMASRQEVQQFISIISFGAIP